MISNFGFLQKTDRDQYYNLDIVKNVVNILINEGKTFFKNIAFIINNSSKEEEFNNLIPDISLLERRKLQNNPELQIVFGNLLGNLCDIYRHRQVDNLRGAILELVVYKLMKKKYNNCNDNVHINGRVSIDTWNSLRSVDVIALNENFVQGECYECKISAHGFNKDQLKNLIEIKDNSFGIINPNIASFAFRKALKEYINELCPSNSDINLYGHEDLRHLAE
jgi:hypothetical protein